MPLVLRWDGQVWQTADTSGLSDDPALLMAAWTAAGGRATVAGAAWDRDSTPFEGLTGRSGGGWTTNALTALPGQTGLTAVDGVEGTGARLAGSTVYIGAAVRTCGPVGVARAGRDDARTQGRSAGTERRVARAERRAIREERRRRGTVRRSFRDASQRRDEALAPRPLGSWQASRDPPLPLPAPGSS